MNVNIYRGDLQCCRVCLATDIKLISLDHPLKQTYSEFSGVPIMSTDGLPQHICEFCLAMLEKSLEFQRKCKSTYNLLARQLLDLHALTTSYIKLLDRSNLRPPLTISDIWQCDCLPNEEICMSDKETADDCNFDVILMRKEDIIKELLEKRESKHNNKKFRCELCFMGFVTENTLQNHMTIHDKSLPYSCEYCHVGFKQSWKLKGHVARMHRYKFICRQCGQVKLNTSDVRQHHRSHSGDRYLCEHCGKTFNIYKSRMEHIRIHHGSVACDICHIKFATKAGLVIHKTKTHRELFKCPVCLVQFHSANALKIHTEVTARACGEHIRPCTRCGSSFDSKEALTRHIFDEHPPNIGGSGNYRGPIRRRPKSPKSPKPGKLECSVCSVGGFQNESALRYHKQRFHTNFICDYCNKGFQKKQAMALHIRTAHLGERPYTCRHSGCGRTFKHLSGHLSHLRTHSDERPFICDHCSFAFKSKQMMEKHISTIHLGERRYSCPRAGCGRAFKQHHHLVNHLRSHSDEKSFSCDSCPKIFKYSASLYEHRKIVHEGKPGRKRNHR
ncbi:zinc-finger associated domain (zf-AD) domain-containing protein [Phthorimaea operculella]|nr:zinc-finger associated domain (zf-AD) domain-containing protein [Phthorimaea operculella]